ncbi:MAG: hypothetical protein AB7P02_09895 [Alphaproteobacteria bacterium]
MRTGFVTIAAAMAMLPALAGAARADITLINQAEVKLTFTINPYAAPGQEVMAVICGQVDVPSGDSATVPVNPSCGQRATIGAGTVPDIRGWSATCRAEGLSWADGRLTVTGGARSIVCTP